MRKSKSKELRTDWKCRFCIWIVDMNFDDQLITSKYSNCHQNTHSHTLTFSHTHTHSHSLIHSFSLLFSFSNVIDWFQWKEIDLNDWNYLISSCWSSSFVLKMNEEIDVWIFFYCVWNRKELKEKDIFVQEWETVWQEDHVEECLNFSIQQWKRFLENQWVQEEFMEPHIGVEVMKLLSSTHNYNSHILQLLNSHCHCLFSKYLSIYIDLIFWFLIYWIQILWILNLISLIWFDCDCD